MALFGDGGFFGFFQDDRTEIEKYMDDLNYFEKRILITDALHNREIESPFTKKEIIEYAHKEAESGMFNASYNAIKGYENDIYFIGKPEVDPLTGVPNPEDEQKGVIGEVGDKLKGGAVKGVLALGVGVLAFYYLKEKGRSIGNS